MTLEEITEKFNQEIDKFLNRIQINHIVCQTPYMKGSFLTEDQADAFIEASPFNRLPINNIILLNNHKDSAIRLQTDEEEALHDALLQCCQFIWDEVEEFCKDGSNKYELNTLLGKTLAFLDAQVQDMNFRAWWQSTFDNDIDDIFFVLFDTKKVWKTKMRIDIETSCQHFLSLQFNYRQNLLYRIKGCIIDIYSSHLLLPEIKTLPKFQYDGNEADICELIFAVSNSGKISNSDHLKAIMLEMFGISRQAFSSGQNTVLRRRKEKAVFLQKLADMINAMSTNDRNDTNNVKELLNELKE